MNPSGPVTWHGPLAYSVLEAVQSTSSVQSQELNYSTVVPSQMLVQCGQVAAINFCEFRAFSISVAQVAKP